MRQGLLLSAELRHITAACSHALTPSQHSHSCWEFPGKYASKRMLARRIMREQALGQRHTSTLPNFSQTRARIPPCVAPAVCKRGTEMSGARCGAHAWANSAHNAWPRMPGLHHAPHAPNVGGSCHPCIYGTAALQPHTPIACNSWKPHGFMCKCMHSQRNACAAAVRMRRRSAWPGASCTSRQPNTRLLQASKQSLSLLTPCLPLQLSTYPFPASTSTDANQCPLSQCPLPLRPFLSPPSPPSPTVRLSLSRILYPTHMPLGALEKGAVALFSAVGALLR